MRDVDGSDVDRTYREIIDRLVRECHTGQGQIGPERVRSGEWNANATVEFCPDQHEIKLLLARISAADREVVAQMLEKAFEAGVHSVLVTLHETGLVPFDKAYEGTPFHDFVGRLADWEWPKSATRS